MHISTPYTTFKFWVRDASCPCQLFRLKHFPFQVIEQKLGQLPKSRAKRAREAWEEGERARARRRVWPLGIGTRSDDAPVVTDGADYGVPKNVTLSPLPLHSTWTWKKGATRQESISGPPGEWCFVKLCATFSISSVSRTPVYKCSLSVFSDQHAAWEGLWAAFNPLVHQPELLTKSLRSRRGA